MIAKSMTPETDAQTAHYGGLERVPADFARNLERRLAVAIEALENIPGYEGVAWDMASDAQEKIASIKKKSTGEAT